MEKTGFSRYALLQALLAAALFGLSAPMAKLLLGAIEPVPLASCLYLGSGFGLLLYRFARWAAGGRTRSEAAIRKKDAKWLAGAILSGGVLAPILLMTSLKGTPADTASLLLNFECVATTLIAAAVFREAIGKRVWAAVVLITAASVLLTWKQNGEWGFSLSALGVLGACALWGADNNFTRCISAKDPIAIVTVKGIGAGAVSLAIALCLKIPLPGLTTALLAMALGFFCYGLSIVLFILAMRGIGSSRASAFFSAAPFIGSAASFLLFRDMPGSLFWISLPVMVLGAVLILGETHRHEHLHERLEHEHRHGHDDGHHSHPHDGGEAGAGDHSHTHVHEGIRHSHSHAPDIHHRHGH